MDIRGYEELQASLSEAELNVQVVPKPEQGQDVAYVTVASQDGERLIAATVLNALDTADIGKNRGMMRRYASEMELVPISQTETTITFKDEHARV